MCLIIIIFLFKGDELLNVSGVVRFVGKVGKKSSTSPIYVGLKLDQPCKLLLYLIFIINTAYNGQKK